MKKLRMTILGDFEKCGHLCKVNWGEVGMEGLVDKQGSSQNKYSQMGIIFHEVMEFHAVKHMEDINVSRETLHELLDEKLKTFDMELLDAPEELEEWKNSLHEQIDWAYYEGCLEYSNVIGAEVTFNLDGLIDGIELPFTGTIDRITGNLDKKEVDLNDWKTGKVYTKKELNNNIQATVYSLAFYRQFGFLPETFRFYFTKHKKIKEIRITPDFLERGIERILTNWYKIKNNEFVPNTSNKYFCKNFCSIRNDCPTQKRVKTTGWEMVK